MAPLGVLEPPACRRESQLRFPEATAKRLLTHPSLNFLATPGSSRHSYFYAVRKRPDCKGAVFSGRYAGSLTSDPC